MSNVFFVSSCLEMLKLKYIFAITLSSMECWLHLKHFWKTNLNWGADDWGRMVSTCMHPRYSLDSA